MRIIGDRVLFSVPSDSVFFRFISDWDFLDFSVIDTSNIHLHILFHSETKITISIILIRFHSLSLVITRWITSYHLLPFLVTRCQSLYDSLSLVVIICHSLYHSLSLAAIVIHCNIRCHSLSLDVPLFCPFKEPEMQSLYISKGKYYHRIWAEYWLKFVGFI